MAYREQVTEREGSQTAPPTMPVTTAHIPPRPHPKKSGPGEMPRPLH